jgi:hypothetical protein
VGGFKNKEFLQIERPEVRMLGKNQALMSAASRVLRLIDAARRENLRNPFRTDTG